jgi:hypothetical protein
MLARSNSRAALEARAARLEAMLGDELAALTIALGEFASHNGDAERANELLQRIRRGLIEIITDYGKITIGAA